MIKKKRNYYYYYTFPGFFTHSYSTLPPILPPSASIKHTYFSYHIFFVAFLLLFVATNITNVYYIFFVVKERFEHTQYPYQQHEWWLLLHLFCIM